MNSRRDFLKAATALPLIAAAQSGQLLPGLQLIRGAVNTAIFDRHGKKLLIDSGDLTGVTADWALFTHYHRDQASGAPRLAASGTKIAAPAAEASLFSDVREFWDSADSIIYHRYDFRPSLFTLREPVKVTRLLKGGDTLLWEGLKFEVIETPGHTDGSLTYLVEIGGKRVAFTGDLICGRGQIWEVYSLQKKIPGMTNGYTGFGAAAGDVKASLDRVLEAKPDLLIPSHGPVIANPPEAVAELKKNLDALMLNFLSTAGFRIAHKGVLPPNDPPMALPPLPPVPYPKWLRETEYTSRIIVADDRSVFLSDCGSQAALDKLSQLRVEGIWITHYHDDHTEYVNAVRRRFGAKVYVQRELVDIIQNPTAYNMPCLYPESIHVDRILEHGETILWKEFKLTAYYFPGQTLYHAGLLVERDGYKVFLSGDSFNNWGINPSTSENRCFLGRHGGYEDCVKLLLEVKPHMMVSAHYGPVPLTEDYLRQTLTILEERRSICEKLLPHDDANFGLDPYWIRAYPYRQPALPGSRVSIEARIMNHSLKPKRARATLNLPDGWQPIEIAGEQEVPPRTEARIRLTAVSPPSPKRTRHVLGIAAIFDNHPVGEFAEAIVDILDYEPRP